MSSYWDNLERFLNEHQFEDAAVIADGLITQGWAPEVSRDGLRNFFLDHDETRVYDDDLDGDSHCKCGKWLERDDYEWPDHVSSVLEDTDLLTPGRPWEVQR